MKIRKTVTLDGEKDFPAVFRTMCLLSKISHTINTEEEEYLIFVSSKTGEVLFRANPIRIKETITLLSHMLETDSTTIEIF